MTAESDFRLVPELQSEFEAGKKNGRVGHELLSETERVRVWNIRLKPGERIGFHTHVLDYFWTAVTPGAAQSHINGGAPKTTVYQAGDTRHFHYPAGERMTHDLENVGDTELVFVTVEFLDSANEPLAIHAAGDLL